MKQINKREVKMGIGRIFEIRINSSERNKDNGFAVLRNSKLSVVCLEDEKYIIPESAIALLQKEGITYDILKIDGAPYAPKNPN